MKKNDITFVALATPVCILCYVSAGLDLALFFKYLKTDIFRALLELILTGWLYYWGYKNTKNVTEIVRGWINENKNKRNH